MMVRTETDQMDRSSLVVPLEGSIFAVPAVPKGTMLTLMVPTFGDQRCEKPTLKVPIDKMYTSTLDA